MAAEDIRECPYFDADAPIPAHRWSSHKRPSSPVRLSIFANTEIPF
jgi:hypothetical protein